MINKEIKFLDSISNNEFLELMTKNKALCNIIEEIENKYNQKYINLYPEDDSLFNRMDKYDFQDYIEKRFPDIHFYTYEEIRIR